ncbi:MAG: LacI family transcriptional regulator [Propionibacteriaceae bacterium]|nr:LacI family transcriptional regulator [Propionibacteriaceae bacterium]
MRQNVTIRDVAQRAGVSAATASRVLSGNPSTSASARAKVRQAARELQFHVNARAKSLRRQQTDTIGLLLPDIRNPFFAEIAQAAEQAALAAGMTTLLCNANESTAQQDLYLKLLVAQRVDGIIAAPQGDGSGKLDETIALGLPLVFVDRVIEGVDVPSVTSDNWSGVRQAVRHLVGLGHRRIGFVTGSQETSTGRERLQAYREALVRAGIRPDKTLIRYGNFQTESGLVAARSLLDLSQPPTAVIAADSLMTLGVVQACNELGLVIGETLSVIGYDDTETTRALSPGLTVISHDPAAMGTQAFAMLRDVLGGRRVPSVVLPVSLVIRNSTGPVPLVSASATSESGARR